MKKVCIFTLYSEKGASSRYRAFIFKEKLDKSFDTVWYNFWDDNYTSKYLYNKKKYRIQIMLSYIIAILKRIFQLYFVAPKCDVVFIQKGVIPKIQYTFLRRLRKKKVKIVFDVDDAIYTERFDNSEKIAKLSNLVICGNNLLKQHYSRFNRNCIFLPTIDETYKYQKYWKSTFENKTIGWIGSKTTVNNLELIVKPINNIVKKHPNVKFNIISNTALHYDKIIKNSRLIIWNQETYIKEMSDFTIGIMPLKDNEFNRGKCGFKLIQYLNMKKPVIASDVGVNSKIVGNNGFIAYNEEDWEEKIEKLLFNQEIYDDKLMQIEKEFFKKYDFESISNKMISLISELIEDKE